MLNETLLLISPILYPRLVCIRKSQKMDTMDPIFSHNAEFESSDTDEITKSKNDVKPFHDCELECPQKSSKKDPKDNILKNVWEHPKKCFRLS